MPIIGTVEVARSFIFKITGDANPHSGMGKFESKEIFASYKASTTPEDLADVSAMLYAMAEQDVMTAATRHQNFTLEPVQAPTNVSMETPPAPVMTQTPAMNTGYVVVEKATEKAPEKAPAPEQKPDTAKPPAAIIADRLKELGVTKDEITAWLRQEMPESATRKLSQEEYVAVFTKAEDLIKSQSIEAFRKVLATAPVSRDDMFTQDAAVKAAMSQITGKWPLWSPELTKIAALWCADQVKDAGALEAFLIAGGMNDQTPLPRIEAFLAITRHLAFSAGKDVLDYSKKSGDPLSMIEADLSKAVGQPIRFAIGLPTNQVTDVLVAMIESKKKGSKK